MGQGNTKSSGGTNAPITSDLIDQFHSALDRDIVPRAGGVPTASAGSIGTEVFPFSAGYFDRIFVGDQEVSTGGPGEGGNVGGPGSITAGSTVRNGVVSGIEPAGRPGVSGWLHQAGSSGVVVSATSSDPLVVKLDSTTYTRESNITGGTLPADFSQTIVPPVADYGVSEAGGGTWVAPSTRYIPMNADRANYRYATGGTFAFHSISATEVLPDNYGTNIIIKSSGAADGSTAYSYCQRVSSASSPSGERNLAKLFRRSVFNTSPTAQIYDSGNFTEHTAHKAIRCAALFCDPLTATWSLTIAPRVVGVVNERLPGTTGYSAGECLFRELDARWYRFSGTIWQRTSFVFLGFLAIDGGAVEAVLPALTENSLSATFDKKFAFLGDAVSREGQVDGDLIRFGGRRSEVEEKGYSELGSGQPFQVGTSAVVDTSDNERGTLSNDEMFCVYLDVNDNNFYFSTEPPVWQVYRQRLLLLHPNRSNRLFVGTFITDSSGALIAAQSISNQGNKLNEGNDDSFRYANPCLFGRSKLTDLGQPEDRRMQITLRGKGTRSSGTNSFLYRAKGSRQFWSGYHLNKERWDQLMFSYLTPHTTSEIEFDTDNNPDLVVAFSQWDEGSLLYAAGLTEAAREGRARAVASGAAAGGTVASIDTPQYSPGSIGGEAIGSGAVDPFQMAAINDPAVDLFAKVVQDPDDPNILRWQFVAAAGGGGTPDDLSVDWDKFAASVIANERDVLDPDSDDPKIISNLTMHDILEDIRQESAEFWTDWATPATVAITNTTDNAVVFAGFMRVRNSASVNVKTVALPTNGEALLCTTTCTGFPTLPNGTLRGGVLMEYEGVRWMLVIDNPETTSDIDFYYLDSSSVWQPVGYKGDELYTNFNGILHNNRWAPMSAVAKNGAPGQGLGMGAFESITKWDNVSTGILKNIQYQIRVVYDTTDNQFKYISSHRYFDLLANTKVNFDDLNLSGSISNGDFLQKWTTTNALGQSVDIIRGGRPTLATRVQLANYTGSGLSTTTTEQTASGNFTSYQFLSFKFCDTNNSDTCYTTPLYAVQDWTVGDEIGFTRPHAADPDQIAVVRNSGNNKFQLSYRPSGGSGLSLKAIYGYNF